MKIAIIGGGAAGFFSAITAKENYPESAVIIFEKSPKLLSKVKISGGGRCNVTNSTSSIKELTEAYPRGGKKLKSAFQIFNTRHTMEWFELRGVPLMVQENNYVFPASQDSQTIIDCFLNETIRLGIEIITGRGIKKIKPIDQKLELHFSDEKISPEIFDKIIVATGGSPKREGLRWLEELGHKIEDPVPSLFTFNMPGESIAGLMGVSVEKTIVSIPGTKLRSEGALLITHWGMSGPAILKLSSFGARILSDMNYNFKIQVSWTNNKNQEVVLDNLRKISEASPNKILSSIKPYTLPERLWNYLILKIDLPAGKKWGELGKKGLNKISNVLTNDVYTVKGKTTFKEEFVTCGGVSLESIDLKTMKSKVCGNLYFAGEVMDIDGITGGFNFQSAWTTGFIAGKLG